MRIDPVWGCAALLLSCALGASASAYAQWDGSASQQLGMGHGFNALSQSTMRNAMNATGEEAQAKAKDYAGSGMTRDARLAALRTEYVERVREDGQGSADAWAFEMGRRDASRIDGSTD